MTRSRAGRAVLVGIDTYAAGWRLSGPVRDACRLAAWVLDQGVPADQVTLLLSPPTDPGLGVAVRPADHQTVRTVLVDELSHGESDFLLLHWGGHGVVDGADNRYLFCADASLADKRNVDVNSLLAALRSTRYRHPRQAVLIDACQTHVENLNLAHALTTEPFPRGEPRGNLTQRVLMAASPGQVAVEDTDRRTGLFSSVVRAELTDWPPNLDLLRERVDRRFVELRAAGRTAQVPSYLWTRGEDGERLLFTPTRNRRGRLPAATVGELTDLLLELDEFASETDRWAIVLALLPRPIVAALASPGPQRLQIITLIRTCERFPYGPAALLDAIRTAVADDAQRARVEAAFQEVWPA